MSATSKNLVYVLSVVFCVGLLTYLVVPATTPPERQVSSLNLAKILALSAMFRDARVTPETMPNDAAIRYYLVHYLNYRNCADYPFWEDIEHCMGSIPDTEVALVRQAIAHPETFRVFVETQQGEK